MATDYAEKAFEGKTGRIYKKWFAWYPVKIGLRRPDSSCLGKWYNGWRWLCFVDRGNTSNKRRACDILGSIMKIATPKTVIYWRCENCNELNWFTRFVCNDCEQLKPIGAVAVDADGKEVKGKEVKGKIK